MLFRNKNSFKLASNLLLANSNMNKGVIIKRSIHLTKSTNFFFRKSQHIKHHNYQNEAHIVNGVFTDTGAVLPVPKWYKFGLTKVIFAVCLSTFLGWGACLVVVDFLQDQEFVAPDNDDDDD